MRPTICQNLPPNPKTRAKRLISDRNRPEYGLSSNEVYERIEKRDQNDISRLERIYSINFDSMTKQLNLVLDNSFNTINESLIKALDCIISTCPQNSFNKLQ